MIIFITGSSGYLGRFILKNIDRKKYKIICLINSEKRFKEIEYYFRDCKIYKGDIKDKNLINKIFNENDIDYVIHSAAMKYIDTCEKFQKDCIDTNIIGTLNICENAKKYGIKNVVSISTDKANDPSSLYGISKLATERITLSHGYTVYQGVNFWNSDGSFTQKWRSAINNKFPVRLYNPEHIRFFSDPNDTANDVLDLVENNNNKVNYPKTAMQIKILDVFNILKEKYLSNEFTIQSSFENAFDKDVEEIDDSIILTDVSKDKLSIMIDNFMIC